MSDFVRQLRELKALVDEGILTSAEFEDEKRRIIAERKGDTSQSPHGVLSGGTSVNGPTPPEKPAPAPREGKLQGETVVHEGATVPGPSKTVETSLLSGATTIDSMSALPKQLGSYRVLELLGKGGMGLVVRARHVEEETAALQGGDVAIKLILPQIASDPIFRDRFLREADLGKQLRHPSIAKCYDVVMDKAWLGMSMEYVEGEELSAWVKPGGLPLDKVFALLKPLAAALDHLHAQGIIHRDIKPANIKVRPDGTPVILDLGIAKNTQSNAGLTMTMTTMGTISWMAPEQADAKNVTPAADRYALGMIAYALLSGQMPWEEEASEARVLANKLEGRLTPLSSHKPDLIRYAADAVMKMLSVDPQIRFESCAGFVEELTDPYWKEYVDQIQSVRDREDTSLSLTGWPYSDFSRLKGLTSLSTLRIISGPAVADLDLEVLGELSGITHLSLKTRAVIDLRPLQRLKNLNKLFLSTLAVTNFSPLAVLPNLSTLSLSIDHFVPRSLPDLDVLLHMPDLKELQLWIPSNLVPDLMVLKNLTNLTSLTLLVDDQTDLSPLMSLTNLKELSLSGEDLKRKMQVWRLKSILKNTAITFNSTSRFSRFLSSSPKK